MARLPAYSDIDRMIDWKYPRRYELRGVKFQQGISNTVEELNELKQLQKAKSIPTKDFDGNLEAYRHLAALKPKNTHYQKKIATYERMKKNSVPLSPSDGTVRCKRLVKLHAQYPDEIDFGRRNDRTDGNILTVTGTVKMMNGFGMMTPQFFKCVFEGEDVKSVDVWQ